MEFNWDLLVSILILVGLGLMIAAKITNQKIIDLLRDIRDFISESREEAVERGQEVFTYE